MGGTDWQDLMFRTAHTQNYKLSISGGIPETSIFGIYEYDGHRRHFEGIEKSEIQFTV